MVPIDHIIKPIAQDCLVLWTICRALLRVDPLFSIMQDPIAYLSLIYL